MLKGREFVRDAASDVDVVAMKRKIPR